MRFCLCFFESDTVKSDCPMQENYEIFKYLIQTVGLLYLFNCLFCFQSFFLFFPSPDPKYVKKIPVNELLKKIWPYKSSTQI